MAGKVSRVKVQTKIGYDRIQTLALALGLKEEEVVEKAVEAMWQGNTDMIRQYFARLHNGSALFEEVGPVVGEDSSAPGVVSTPAVVAG